MPPDASATKERILRAAFREFAQFGLAGARVDRIAEAASANKRSIYVHFGIKEELFDFVVGRALAEMAEEVAFSVEDLSGYAGRLFDYLRANPDVLRLTVWARLERPDSSLEEVATYRAKVNALAVAQRSGRLSASVDPADLLALVLAAVTSWANASPALRGLAGEPDGSDVRLSTHRRAVLAAVAAIVHDSAPIKTERTN